MKKFEGWNVPEISPDEAGQNIQQESACSAAYPYCNKKCSHCLFDYERKETLPAFLCWEKAREEEE